MFHRQEDVFADDSKERKKEYQEELKKEKEEEKKQREEDKKAREKLLSAENFADEPETEFDEVVTVSQLLKKEEKKQQNKITPLTVIGDIFLVILIFGSGFFAAWLASFLNQTPFSPLGEWALIISMDIFCATSAGYFCTKGKLEKVYGFFSVLALICFVLELAITFQ